MKDAKLVLGQTADSLIESVTGIGISEKKDWIKSAGHILQHARGGRFLESLKEEWNGYREKGKIKEDYESTNQCWDTLKEILESIDQDMPDRIRFDAMKKVFLNTATEKFSNRDSLMPYEFMKITRRLTSAQVIILSACYNFYDEDQTSASNVKSYEEWNRIVLEKSELQYREILDVEEKGLVGLGLLTERVYGDGSGIHAGRFRFTTLGLHLCEFIAKES
jgi:hypothetical protein